MPQSSAGRPHRGQRVARPTPLSNSRLSRLQHCHSKWHLGGRRRAELPVFAELQGRSAPVANRVRRGVEEAALARGATPCRGVRSALRGVPIVSHLGSARLDTPLFSGRVEVAKNDANPGASEICRQLREELVPSSAGVADGPQIRVLRRDRDDFCERARGPARRGRGASGGRRAEKGPRGAQGVVHQRILAAAWQGSSSEGSLSQVTEPGRARHRLCSIERGEATHHGAEPVSEEKVE
jgi:hypothetical protein